MGEDEGADGRNGLHHPCFRQAHDRFLPGVEQGEDGFLFLVVRLAGVPAGGTHAGPFRNIPQKAQLVMGDGSESLHQAVRQRADQQGAVGVVSGFPFLCPAAGAVHADRHGPHVIPDAFGSDEVRQRQPGFPLFVQLLALRQQRSQGNGSGFISPDGDVVMTGC